VLLPSRPWRQGADNPAGCEGHTVTFAAFAEPSEYVTDMSPWLNYSQFTACFVPYDGRQVSCP
jgi:hypothetical protein